MADPRIGKRLQECRQKAGLGQSDLAKLTGMGVPAISNIERGNNYPTVDNLVAMMNAIGASPNYVFQDVVAPSLSIKSLGDFDALPEAKKAQIIKIIRILLEEDDNEPK